MRPGDRPDRVRRRRDQPARRAHCHFQGAHRRSVVGGIDSRIHRLDVGSGCCQLDRGNRARCDPFLARGPVAATGSAPWLFHRRCAVAFRMADVPRRSRIPERDCERGGHRATVVISRRRTTLWAVNQAVTSSSNRGLTRLTDDREPHRSAASKRERDGLTRRHSGLAMQRGPRESAHSSLPRSVARTV